MAFSSNPASVVLVRTGGLGDVILLLPTIRALRAAGLSPWICAPLRHAEAVVGPGDAEGCIDWESPQVAGWLGGRADDDAGPGNLDRFGVAVVFSRQEALIQRFERSAAVVLRRDPQPAPGRHAADWYLEAVRPLLPAAAPTPSLMEPCRPTPEERREAARILGLLPPRFLAIHPGSGSKRKNWPTAWFGALADALRAGGRWLLVAGPAESSEAALLRSWPEVILADSLHPRVLGAILSQSGTYVGNDSGVSHLAGAWGAPTLALFGPTDPGTWAPVGPFVRIVRAPHGRIEDLRLDAVADAAGAMWSRPSLPCG